jgi:hypothetical protein
LEHREYLQGPDAETLYRGLSERLRGWGKHTSEGALAALTPRAIILLALYAGHRVAVRWIDDHGDLAVVGGMPWDVEGDLVLVMTPSNTPGAYTTSVPVDSIVSVEVMAYDALVGSDRVTRSSD